MTVLVSAAAIEVRAARAFSGFQPPSSPPRVANSVYTFFIFLSTVFPRKERPPNTLPIKNRVQSDLLLIIIDLDTIYRSVI